MLSKAEILYLQGQKQVSQSYERKLKCLMRKKIEVLQKELPLLSKLFGGGVNSFMDISTATKLAAPIAKDNGTLNEPFQQLPSNNRATKFSNLESNDDETDVDKDIKCQNSDESTLLDKENSTPATEFSNAEYGAATKNDNFRNPINITKCFPNLSNNILSSCENLSKSNPNDLISEWAGSGVPQIWV